MQVGKKGVLLKMRNKKECVISVIITFVVFSILYFYYHSKIDISSDTVTMIPIAKAIINGNYLLKGWTVGTNNFLFTETIFYIPGLLLSINVYTLVKIMGSLTFALFVAVNAAMFLYKSGIRYAISYLLIVGIVVPSMAYTLLNSNSHNGVYIFIVIEWYLLMKFEDTLNKYSLVVFIVLGVLAQYSDGVFLMELIAPAIIYSIYQFIRVDNKKDKRKKYCILLVSNVSIFVVSKILQIGLEKVGGLVTKGLPMGLVSIREIPQRIVNWKNEFMNMWGYDFNGSSNVAKINNVIIYFFILFLLVAICYYGILILLFRIERKELAVWLMVIFNIAGCLGTNVVICHRYFIPTYIWEVALELMFIRRIADYLQIKNILSAR